MQYGLFICRECGKLWPDEIPPMWLEVWPECCGQLAHLLELLERVAV